MILSELSKEFGGQARAELETYAGKMKQLKNELGNLMEEIGKAITGSSDWIATIKEWIASATEFVKVHPNMVKTIAELGVALLGLGSALLVVAPLLSTLASLQILLGGAGVAGAATAAAGALGGAGLLGVVVPVTAAIGGGLGLGWAIAQVVNATTDWIGVTHDGGYAFQEMASTAESAADSTAATWVDAAFSMKDALFDWIDAQVAANQTVVSDAEYAASAVADSWESAYGQISGYQGQMPYAEPVSWDQFMQNWAASAGGEFQGGEFVPYGNQGFGGEGGYGGGSYYNETPMGGPQWYGGDWEFQNPMAGLGVTLGPGVMEAIAAGAGFGKPAGTTMPTALPTLPTRPSEPIQRGMSSVTVHMNLTGDVNLETEKDIRDTANKLGREVQSALQKRGLS